MMLGMPNLDKTFTCNVFMPLKGEISFETFKAPEDFEKFVHTYFPDAAEIMPSIIENYTTRKVGRLHEVKCFPWRIGNFCLIGDAAHSITPFFGQGLNCGLEDCQVLSSVIDSHRGDWAKITQEFQTQRKPNGDAIADLSQ